MFYETSNDSFFCQFSPFRQINSFIDVNCDFACNGQQIDVFRIAFYVLYQDIFQVQEVYNNRRNSTKTKATDRIIIETNAFNVRHNGHSDFSTILSILNT